MAVTITKSAGLMDSEWNQEADFIQMKMADADTEKSADEKIVSDLFNVETSKRFGEKLVGSSSFGSFGAVVNPYAVTTGEGGDFATDTMQDVNPKLIQHVSFGKEFSITPEMKEDNQHDIAARAARNLVHAYKRTRAEFAVKALSSSIQTASSTYTKTFSYGGASGIDCSVYDVSASGNSVSLFSTAHGGMNESIATQSNVFTNALIPESGDADAMLDRLANIGFNFKNASGQPMGYVFDTIILPANAYAEIRLAKKICNSDQQVGNNNNDVNINKGMWKLVVLPYWQYSGNNVPYILMSSTANKEIGGNMFYDRLGLTVKQDIDIHNHALITSGRGRMGVGFSDWRHVIMGGAAYGTTLT